MEAAVVSDGKGNAREAKFTFQNNTMVHHSCSMTHLGQFYIVGGNMGDHAKQMRKSLNPASSPGFEIVLKISSCDRARFQNQIVHEIVISNPGLGVDAGYWLKLDSPMTSVVLNFNPSDKSCPEPSNVVAWRTMRKNLA